MSKNQNYGFAFGVIAILFFIFGFVTWLNGILIPYLKIACELNNFESLLVAFAFYISYFVMAIPSAWVLNKTGFKNGMSLGLFVMAIGAALFIPAAITRTYFLFLTGLFVLGTGLSILQTASNPYVTILGPLESAAKRISIMGICNKIAGVLSPIILGAIVLKDADQLVERLKTFDSTSKAMELDALAERVIVPYLIITAVLIVLSLIIYFMNLPNIEQDEETSAETKEDKPIYAYGNLMWGVITLFLYVGVEVIAGDTIINYGVYQGIELSQAKNFTSFTLVAMVIGYILGIISIPKYIKQEKALLISGILSIVFSASAIVTSGYYSVASIALLGLSNSLMWPAIWPMAIKGLGRYTKLGSSLLIMAIAGGAILPLVYGRLADSYNPQQAYVLLLPCYAMVVGYAWKFRIRN